MKYLISILLFLGLSINSYAYISDWNVEQHDTRINEHQFNNYHPFFGLFGAGVEETDDEDARVNLEAYLNTCKSDAPSENADADLKEKFRSLFITDTYNALCFEDLTYKKIDGKPTINVTFNNEPMVVHAADCNGVQSDIIDSLYEEWIDSLTSNRNYDFKLSTSNITVSSFVGFDVNLSYTNSNFQTNEVTGVIPTGYSVGWRNSVIKSLSINKTEDLEVVFDQNETNSDRHIIRIEDLDRYVQLFLSSANVDLIQKRYHVDNAHPEGTLSDSFKKLDRTHQLLTFLFNRHDENCLSSDSSCRDEDQYRNSHFEFEAFRLPELIGLCEELNDIPVDYADITNAIILSQVFSTEDELTIDPTHGTSFEGEVNIYGHNGQGGYQIDIPTQLDALKDIDETIASLNTQIKEVSSAFRDANGKLSDANGKLSDAESEFQSVEGELNDIQDKLNEFSENQITVEGFRELRRVLTDQSTDLTDLHKEVTRLHGELNRAQSTFKMIVNTSTSNRYIRFIKLVPEANKISKIELIHDGQFSSVNGYVSSAISGVNDQLIFSSGRNENVLKTDRIDDGSPKSLCSKVTLSSDSTEQFLFVISQDNSDSKLYYLNMYHIVDEDADGNINVVQNFTLDDKNDLVPGDKSKRVENSNCDFVKQ